MNVSLDISSILNDSVALSVCDENGVQIMVNESFCQISDSTVEQLIGKPFLLFLNPESEYSLKNVKENINKHHTFTCEYKFSKPAGACCWVEIKIKPRYNERKEVVGYISIVTNITERKLKKERISQLLASNEIGTWEYLVEEKRFIADDNCFNLLGYGNKKDPSLEEWLSKVHPDDLSDVKNSFFKHLKKEADFFTATYRVKIKGEERYIQTKGKLIDPDCLNSSRRLVGFVHDVTSSKIMEKDIKEQKNFYQSLLDNLPFPLFVKDSSDDFRFSFWNKKAEETWGLKKEEIVGKSDYDLFPKNQADFFRKKDMEVMKNQTLLDIPEEEVETPAGTRLFQTRKVPLFQSGKHLLLGVSQDITEKIDAQKKMLSSSKMATLGQMAGSIAHEINTPLSVITMLSGQIKRALNNDALTKDKGLEFANKIEKTAFRISKIVKSLKTVSRDGSNDPMQVTTLGSIIDDTLELCQMSLHKSEISLIVPEYNREALVNCRATEISQILLNLINNSKDAISNLAEKWIKINIKVTKRSIYISVIDSGRGIPLHIRDKIMSPFFTTKGVEKGTGLGLSISRQIAIAHGGNLELNPTSEHTCFKLTLPLYKPN